MTHAKDEIVQLLAYYFYQLYVKGKNPFTELAQADSSIEYNFNDPSRIFDAKGN